MPTIVAGQVGASQAPNPPPAIPVLWIVTSFGAWGNGVRDDTAALQRAADAVRTMGGTMYFPPGRYLVSATIDLGKSQGVVYEGAGSVRRRTALGQDGVYPFYASVIVWNGATGAGPVVKWDGNECRFDNLTIQGGFDLDVDHRPSIGFHLLGHLDGADGGIAPGKADVPRIQFINCQVGWQCGTVLADNNADVSRFGRFGAYGCDVAFKVVNDQGLLYTFQDVKADVCTTVFQFDAGGQLNCEVLNGVQCQTLLLVTGAGTTACTYRIGFVSLDPTGDTVPVVWVKHTGTAGRDVCNVVIDGGSARLASNFGSTEACFQMGPRSRLRVSNVNGGMTGKSTVDPVMRPLVQLTGTSGRSCSAVFTNCYLDDTDPTTGDWVVRAGTGNTRHAALRDCYRTNFHTIVATTEATS